MRRWGRIVAALAAALVLVGVVAQAMLDRERAPMNAAARAMAPGKFARLRDGLTHYDLAGPDGGPVIVLLSGGSVPFYIWDPTRDALAANGFRVLRYDYYGRGFSDRPDVRYDLATYERQLVELLDALGVRGPVHVAGISMGGVVAAHFADRHPARVRSLTMVDPGFAYLDETPLPLRAPGVADLVMTLAAPDLAKGQLDDFLHPERHPDWVSRYEVQMRYDGFRRSIIRTMRGDTFKRPARSFAALARSGIPILLLWGKEDRTVPIAQSDSVRAAFPRAEFHAIDGAGHLPQIEQAAVVDSLLLRFLRAH